MTADSAIGITGTGSYVPRTAVTNEQLASVLDTEAEAIHRVTGIEERRIRDERENIYVMGALAGLRALEDARLEPDQIDAIYCGIDPIGEVSVPAAANLVQYLMGMPLLRAEDGSKAPNYCPSCDVVAGCCGPLFALEAAVGRVLTDRHLRDKRDTKVLVVAGDSMSNIVNWQDRETAMVFADGAGAVVVENLEAASSREGVVALDASRPMGILSIDVASDGDKADLLHQFSQNRATQPGEPSGSEDVAKRHFVHMKGAEVYRHAVRRLTTSLKAAMAEAGVSDEDVDHYLPHQANLQILRKVFGEAIPKKLDRQVDRSKVYTWGVVWEGNCSAGTLFIALDQYNQSGRLSPGMTLAMPTFGAGLAWGTVVLRWQKPARRKIDWETFQAERDRAYDPRIEAMYAKYLDMVSRMEAAPGPR